MTIPPQVQSSPEKPPIKERTILGHPRGLFMLFFTEMWERFSYYGMRSLLVLYMVDNLFVRPDVGQKVLGFSVIKSGLESLFGPLAIQPLSSQIYGLYTAFVYLTPFFGGLLADKILGQRRSVILGAVLMALGEFLLMSENAFFLALMLLIMGNGAFKPNISTQVGGLYPPGDPRRDRAFTIFYMGINLGAFFSPLVCGTLGQTLGWRYGFIAAGIGMVLGLVLYLWGQRYLAPDLRMREAAAAATSGPRVKEPLTKNEWRRIWAVCILCGLNVIFWGIYEQQGNTMQLWADRNTNWNFAGVHIPSTWFQAFNPLMIFIFAPLLNIFWGWQSKRGREPSSIIKMMIGCFLAGASYLVMVAATQGATPEVRRSVMWLVGTTFVLTMGELYLSPIGLSFVTKVAPLKIASMMMGVWFLSSFFGNYLSGLLGTFWEKMPRGVFFMMLTILGVAAGLAIWTLSRPLKAIISQHERTNSEPAT